LDLVDGELPDRWLESSGVRPGHPFQKPAFAEAFAAAGRRCGSEPARLLDRERSSDAARAGLAWLYESLTREQAARVALLIAADRLLERQAMVDLLENCFRRGDNGERIAVLRVLSILQEPAGYVNLASQACRSHVQPVFEALACDNPFPAAFLPELAFNQLVLKALFTGAPLQRMLGLRERVTPELRRMAQDYADERRAANRIVPADIDLLG
jgi:hypothetical protein